MQRISSTESKGLCDVAAVLLRLFLFSSKKKNNCNDTKGRHLCRPEHISYPPSFLAYDNIVTIHAYVNILFGCEST